MIKNKITFKQEGIGPICPVCANEFYSLNTELIEKKDGYFLLHTTCKKCKSSMVVLMSPKDSGTLVRGIATDLTVKDLSKFRNSDSISCNDVIRLHQGLSTCSKINLNND